MIRFLSSRLAFCGIRTVIVYSPGSSISSTGTNHAVAREHCTYHAIDFDQPDKKILFYEPISHQTFRAYERTVMDAEYHLNRNYVLGGFISINEYLDFLGLKEIPDGDNAGWSIDSGAYWLDFEHTKMKRTHNGEPMYAINCIFEPDEDWLCGWQ